MRRTATRDAVLGGRTGFVCLAPAFVGLKVEVSGPVQGRGEATDREGFLVDLAGTWRSGAATSTDTYYSGKKKAHTLKSQVAVNLFTGEFIDISESVRGPTADLTLLKDSELLSHLPDEISRMFDLAYVGVSKLCPHAVCWLPRRKPREKLRPPEDGTYNTMIASCRITVEHSIGRLRWYESLKQVDRHHRKNHTARVVSVAGLVNRQIRHRLLNLAN